MSLQLLGGPNGERDIEDCEGGPDDPLHAILRKVRHVIDVRAPSQTEYVSVRRVQQGKYVTI